MSWRATAYVKGVQCGAKGEPLTRSEKLVMFVLADCYNDDEGEAWLAIARLAQTALMSERQVQYCLRSLGQKGLVEVAPGTGRGHPNRYTFPLLGADAKGAKAALFPEGKGAVFEGKGATSSAQRVQFRPRKGATAIAPEPQYKNHKNEPTIEPPEEQDAQPEKPAAPSPRAFTDLALQLFLDKYGQKPTWDAKDFMQFDRLRKRRPELSLQEFGRRYRIMLNSADDFYQRQGGSLAFFCANFDRFIRAEEEFATRADLRHRRKANELAEFLEEGDRTVARNLG